MNIVLSSLMYFIFILKIKRVKKVPSAIIFHFQNQNFIFFHFQNQDYGYRLTISWDPYPRSVNEGATRRAVVMDIESFCRIQSHNI